jgi:hypothetical protein
MTARRLVAFALVTTLVAAACQGCNLRKVGARARGGDAGAMAASTAEDSTPSGEPQVMVERDKRCAIIAPAGWQKTTGLNDEAELQLKSDDGHLFVIVLTEAKEDLRFKSLEAYAAARHKPMVASLEDAEERATVARTTSQGYRAVETEIFGGKNLVNFAYLFSVVESPEYYHQVVGWSTKSNFAKGEPIFRAMADSLAMTVPPKR